VASEAPVRAARAALGDDLVFAAPWLTEGREAPPSVRAARAMALAASGGRPGRAAFQLGGFVAPGTAGAPTTDVAAREVGWALQSLVAPAPAAPAPVTLTPTHATSSSFAGRPPPQPAFVTPATAPAAAAQAQAQARGYSVPKSAPELVKTGAEAASSGARGSADFQIPDWFEAAARKMLAEKSGGGDDRLGLPELTLIGAAATSSTTRLAADKGDTPTPAPSSAPTGESGGKDDEDLDDLAHEIWDHIRRLHEVARQRRGQ